MAIGCNDDFKITQEKTLHWNECAGQQDLIVVVSITKIAA